MVMICFIRNCGRLQLVFKQVRALGCSVFRNREGIHGYFTTHGATREQGQAHPD